MRRFTDEQRAAISDRSGARLLAANAGSGKTAVMVERFVEAVLRDGVPVGAILALTFTEKAAGEMRERVRARFGELGEDEHARAVDGAWIGTIHGFCASSQASAICAGVAFLSSATRRIRSTRAWFFSMASGVKRGRMWRKSFSASLLSLPIAPVRKPLPSGL